MTQGEFKLEEVKRKLAAAQTRINELENELAVARWDVKRYKIATGMALFGILLFMAMAVCLL